jgi:asparagine synthase (glutamine-hydrolysing)
MIRYSAAFSHALPDRGSEANLARRMLGYPSSRQDNLTDLRESGAEMACATEHGSERAFGSAAPVLRPEPGVSVLADASLHYRADLEHELRQAGCAPRGWSIEHLIAAAYRAWGTEFPGHLEGDFAFVLWDRRRSRVLCARDLLGRRELFYREYAGGLLVASSPAPLHRPPELRTEFDLPELAMAAAGCYGSRSRTVWRGIQRLPAAHTLLWERGRVRLAPHWQLPAETGDAPTSMEEAAEELRRLLTGAVRERIEPSGRGCVWLSGGWDSSAVFATARAAGFDVRPISVRFPADDPACETDLVRAVTRRWGMEPEWVEAEELHLLDHPLATAVDRDEPNAHLFDGFNRALADTSRDGGSQVALDGFGGDQLFHVSPVHLADLLLQGHIPSLARAWRRSVIRGAGTTGFANWVMRPNLHALLGDGWLSRRIFGRSHLDRFLPPWIDPAFARRHGLDGLELEGQPRRRPGEAFAAHEMRWYFEYPYPQRMVARLGDVAREEGVDLHSPLCDRRIVELAATRPVKERANGRESKLLLRAAMRPWLPPEFLAPRRSHTGVPATFYISMLRRHYGRAMTEAFRRPVLEELGIIRGNALRERCARFLDGHADDAAYHLVHTLLAEQWAAVKLGCGKNNKLSPQTGPDLAPGTMGARCLSASPRQDRARIASPPSSDSAPSAS